jgi:CheY-like chemotaxis protein
MKETRTEAIPRVLIVDDRPNDLENVRKLLTSPVHEANSSYRYHNDFLIHEACNKEEAMKYLDASIEASLPYTLVLLDLELPGGEYSSTDVGFEILEYIIAKKASVGVIVVSTFPEKGNVFKAFELGATDFVYKKTEGFSSFAEQRILSFFERQGTQLLDQRIRLLTPYLELGLAYHLGTCFSRFVQQVLIETEALEIGFRERWELDIERDAQDPQVRNLIALNKSIKDAKDDWYQIHSALRDGKKGSSTDSLSRLVQEISARVVPCLMLKNVQVSQSHEEEIKILSYKDDVSVVLTELILGALSSISQPPEIRAIMRISMEKHQQEGNAEIFFEDQLDAIPKDEAELINNGKFAEDLIQEKKFGRVWGLSIAQYVAMRGGGRLTVDNYAGGNVITYKVPLAPSA